MDTFAALALATEPPDHDILERMPQPSNESIVTEVMWRNVHGHAIYQMIVLILVLFIGQQTLVERYDIKCFERDAEKGNCRLGSMNPFYTSTHYFDKPTSEYWTAAKAKTYKAEDFDKDAFAKFNCFFLKEDHESKMSGVECTKDNYEKLVTDLTKYPIA